MNCEAKQCPPPIGGNPNQQRALETANATYDADSAAPSTVLAVHLALQTTWDRRRPGRSRMQPPTRRHQRRQDSRGGPSHHPTVGQHVGPQRQQGPPGVPPGRACHHADDQPAGRADRKCIDAAAYADQPRPRHREQQLPQGKPRVGGMQDSHEWAGVAHPWSPILSADNLQREGAEQCYGCGSSISLH